MHVTEVTTACICNVASIHALIDVEYISYKASDKFVTQAHLLGHRLSQLSEQVFSFLMILVDTNHVGQNKVRGLFSQIRQKVRGDFNNRRHGNFPLRGGYPPFR